jgi:hypothetical protein
MQKFLVVLMVMVLGLGFSTVSFSEQLKGGKLEVKAGDEIYVCGCGKGCDCYTVSKKEGKCACGQNLAKVKVEKVEKGKAFYKQDGKEASVILTGKYNCACGAQCDCQTISQKPGKCGCGKEMSKVGDTKAAAPAKKKKEVAGC